MSARSYVEIGYAVQQVNNIRAVREVLQQALDKLGFTYKAVRAANPNIVYAAVRSTGVFKSVNAKDAAPTERPM